ncbi:MAG: class I SAM-dependent methyltransferase [Acidiferrobacterales bacterium]|nr:class I SAM-dependent methyltransferase [Acidiferrobacterales bacterium]
MKLFNLDQHISVIADVKNIFQRLYPNIEITSWCFSRHTWATNVQRVSPDVINEDTVNGFKPEMVKAFQDRYDSFLRQFDGFIVTFPPVFTLLFEKYQKPIFLVNAIRYEHPFYFHYNHHYRDSLEERLKHMQSRGQLIAVSNNRADRDYLKLGADVDSVHIPSLCLYTNASYQPQQQEHVYRSRVPLKKLPNFISIKSLGRHSWQHLYSYQGIVHLPYEISTMSIFEQYSANIPLFFPRKPHLKNLIRTEKIPFNGAMSREHYPDRLDQALGDNWVDYWIDRADYYDQENMKYISYFSSISDLAYLFKHTDHALISQKMQVWNRSRQSDALEKWRSLIHPHYKKPAIKLGKGTGQINLNSVFGQAIFEIAKNPAYLNFLEIGTWNGEGSTVCIMNALLRRNDDSKLISIETDQDQYRRAIQYWSWLEASTFPYKLKLLHGKVCGASFMSREEIENHPAMQNPVKDLQVHYNRDYEKEKATYEKATLLELSLSERLDVVLFDGGEFTTYAEYLFLTENYDPKVIILDDTKTIKCSEIRSELIADEEWQSVFDDQSTRNGASIFRRVARGQ